MLFHNAVYYWFGENKEVNTNTALVGVAISKNATGPFQFVRSYRPNAGFYPFNMTEAQKQLTITATDFKKSWTPE